jgi:putative transposase
VILAWIEERQADWPVVVLCRVLGVSRSGFYAWRKRPPSAAEQRREDMTHEVRRIHAEVRRRYGRPRMHAELVARGHACSVNFVADLMRRAGISAAVKRRFVRTTDSNHSLPVADNVLDRQFEVSEPNAVWLADMTYIPTGEGWVYLAAVEDLYSRRVVGWSMDATTTSRLVVDALATALGHRTPGEELLAHSDRGSRYASEHCQRVLAGEGIVCSMSRKGDCWDNAPMESFFASLKKELVHREEYPTRERSVLQPRPPALVTGVRRPGRVRAEAQPDPPLTSCPLSLGKISRRFPSQEGTSNKQEPEHLVVLPDGSTF